MLDEGEFQEVISKIGTETTGSIRERFNPMLAEYDRITGVYETNPNTIWHHRLSLYGHPCRHCGTPLRTPRAKPCASCMKPVRAEHIAS